MPSTAAYSIILKKENAHNDPIYCCAWAKTNLTGNAKDPGEDFIVTGGIDTHVWKLDNNKLELLHTLQGHSMAVVSVAISPDGHTLASSSLDSSLIIWDLVAGNKACEVQTGATEVWKVTFSPDGSQVATGSHTGKIIVYSTAKGIVERVLDTRGKFALSVAWSADGKYMCSGAVDGTVCIFDVGQGKLVHTVNAHTKSVRSVAFSPNSQLLATASTDGYVKIYNVASANVLSTLEHKSWALCASFSPDGTRVATAAADGSVRVNVVDGLATHYTFREHTDSVWGLQFNAEGNKLMSVSKDKSINIYECPVLPKQTSKK